MGNSRGALCLGGLPVTGAPCSRIHPCVGASVGAGDAVMDVPKVPVFLALTILGQIKNIGGNKMAKGSDGRVT